jgi:nucleoside permease NupC
VRYIYIYVCVCVCVCVCVVRRQRVRLRYIVGIAYRRILLNWLTLGSKFEFCVVINMISGFRKDGVNFNFQHSVKERQRHVTPSLV